MKKTHFVLLAMVSLTGCSDVERQLPLAVALGVVLIIVILLAIIMAYRRNIRYVQYQRDENLRQIALKNAKMKRLEQNEEVREQEIALLSQQIDDQRQRISTKLLVGTRLFVRLQQKESVADITAEERQCLVDYFAQLRPKSWKEWGSRYTDLTTQQQLFLILQDDLHYDDDTIAAMIGVKVSTLRTIRSRIRVKEKPRRKK